MSDSTARLGGLLDVVLADPAVAEVVRRARLTGSASATEHLEVTAPGARYPLLVAAIAALEGQVVPQSVKLPLAIVEDPNLKEGEDFFPDQSDNFFVGNSFPTCGINFTAQEISDLFRQSNPGIPADGIAVLCSGPELSEVRVCMGKDLGFGACGKGVKTQCRAGDIRVPPSR